ncbi:unnamed protein product [Blepharisma stoltei]|uniref:Malectin domain-containing protein n=1 Tax=Blepharisma stoltei TaxID=1481888 RepID=A0AAU9IW89_9CILI|nr:unnamed protein product [Blepharisma stoltei]
MVGIFCLLIPFVFALDPTRVKYAINCGGGQITSSDGIMYQKDTGFSSGVSNDAGSELKVKMTKSPELYQTERYDTQDFSYSIPIEEPGNYVLILKFSEIYFNSEGQKKFFIKIGDTFVVKDLDIYAKVGKNAAYDEFIKFKYEGEKILINGKESKNSVQNGKIKVEFVKGEKDNPKINAIVLVKGELTDTDYYVQTERIKKIQELKELSRKKPIKVERKEEFDQYDYEAVEQNVIERDEDSLLNVILSTPGLVLIAIVSSLTYFACKSTTKNRHPKF